MNVLPYCENVFAFRATGDHKWKGWYGPSFFIWQTNVIPCLSGAVESTPPPSHKKRTESDPFLAENCPRPRPPPLLEIKNEKMISGSWSPPCVILNIRVSNITVAGVIIWKETVGGCYPSPLESMVLSYEWAILWNLRNIFRVFCVHFSTIFNDFLSSCGEIRNC